MAIDLRAKTYCNLGTIIEGNFADDYLQNNGLIKTVGTLKLRGLHTPAVGTVVKFVYEKHGKLTLIPRVMRVLSSFADPYRNTTSLSIGCFLTYLDQLKPPANTYQSEQVIDLYVPPVPAAELAAWVCTQVGLNHDTIPLTNSYAVHRLTPEGGYIRFLSDLLLSESYVGYLDDTETLRFIDLAGGSNYGPLLSNQEVIDVSAINNGSLPAESVSVTYNYQRFNQPGSVRRSWDDTESYETNQYSIPYTLTDSTTNGDTVTTTKYSQTYAYNYTNKIRTRTYYDSLDRVVRRVQTSTKSLGEVNGQWVSAAMTVSNGGGQYLAILPVISTATTETTYVSNDSTEYPYCNMPRLEVTTTEDDYRAVAGTLGINEYVHPSTGALASLPSGSVTISRTEINYDTVVPATLKQVNNGKNKLEDLIYNTGITKQEQTSYVSKHQTLSGQQTLRRDLQLLDETAAGQSTAYWDASLNRVINDATGLTLKGQNTEIVTNREFGFERRPSLQDRINAATQKSANSENTAEVQWILGSPTSTSYIEFSMPYASDDKIVNNVVIPSDAHTKALRFGRAQNALLLGNRSGMNMQLAPEWIAPTPFAPLYFTANGATAQYRANANSWTFNASGLVCSTDALFWGGITSTENNWYPTPPAV